MREGCRDGGTREMRGDVHAELLATRTVCFVAERGARHEAGVLAGGRRDEHVVVGGTPLERLPRVGHGDGDGGQKCFQGCAAIQTLVRGIRRLEADVSKTVRGVMVSVDPVSASVRRQW